MFGGKKGKKGKGKDGFDGRSESFAIKTLPRGDRRTTTTKPRPATVATGFDGMAAHIPAGLKPGSGSSPQLSTQLAGISAILRIHWMDGQSYKAVLISDAIKTCSDLITMVLPKWDELADPAAYRLQSGGDTPNATVVHKPDDPVGLLQAPAVTKVMLVLDPDTVIADDADDTVKWFGANMTESECKKAVKAGGSGTFLVWKKNSTTLYIIVNARGHPTKLTVKVSIDGYSIGEMRYDSMEAVIMSARAAELRSATGVAVVLGTPAVGGAAWPETKRTLPKGVTTMRRGAVTGPLPGQFGSAATKRRMSFKSVMVDDGYEFVEDEPNEVINNSEQWTPEATIEEDVVVVNDPGAIAKSGWAALRMSPSNDSWTTLRPNSSKDAVQMFVPPATNDEQPGSKPEHDYEDRSPFDQYLPAAPGSPTMASKRLSLPHQPGMLTVGGGGKVSAKYDYEDPVDLAQEEMNSQEDLMSRLKAENVKVEEQMFAAQERVAQLYREKARAQARHHEPIHGTQPPSTLNRVKARRSDTAPTLILPDDMVASAPAPPPRGASVRSAISTGSMPSLHGMTMQRPLASVADDEKEDGGDEGIYLRPVFNLSPGAGPAGKHASKGIAGDSRSGSGTSSGSGASGNSGRRRVGGGTEAGGVEGIYLEPGVQVMELMHAAAGAMLMPPQQHQHEFKKTASQTSVVSSSSGGRVQLSSQNTASPQVGRPRSKSQSSLLDTPTSHGWDTTAVKKKKAPPPMPVPRGASGTPGKTADNVLGSPETGRARSASGTFDAFKLMPTPTPRTKSGHGNSAESRSPLEYAGSSPGSSVHSNTSSTHSKHGGPESYSDEKQRGQAVYDMAAAGPATTVGGSKPSPKAGSRPRPMSSVDSPLSPKVRDTLVSIHMMKKKKDRKKKLGRPADDAVHDGAITEEGRSTVTAPSQHSPPRTASAAEPGPSSVRSISAHGLPTPTLNRPNAMASEVVGSLQPLPEAVLRDWRFIETPDGKVYYYNTKTKQTSWTLPSQETAVDSSASEF